MAQDALTHAAHAQVRQHNRPVQTLALRIRQCARLTGPFILRSGKVSDTYFAGRSKVPSDMSTDPAAMTRDTLLSEAATQLGYSFDGEIKIGGNYVSVVRHDG